MVQLPGAVDFPDHLLRRLLVQLRQLHGIAEPGIHRRIDIHVQAVLHIHENAVGAAAHDDAGLLLGKIPDDIFLNQEDFIPHTGNAHAQRVLLLKIDGLGIFFRIADNGHRQAHAAGGLLHNVPVVEVHPQLPGELLGNHPAHGAELPGNGDHILLHGITSCRRAGTAFLRFCILLTTQDRVKLMTK